MSDTPQMDKLNTHASAIDAVTEFIEWAENEGYFMGKYSNDPTRWDGSIFRSEQMSAVMHEHFGVDEAALEQERRDLLSSIQEQMDEVSTAVFAPGGRSAGCSECSDPSNHPSQEPTTPTER